jgi:hypothetical protein
MKLVDRHYCKSRIDDHRRLSGHLSMISHTKQAVASTEIAASF